MGSVQELEAQLAGLKQRKAEISSTLERARKKAKVATVAKASGAKAPAAKKSAKGKKV